MIFFFYSKFFLGGGQPSDTGLIKIKNTNKSIPVYSVKRNGLIALHETPEFIAEGTDVELEVDWKRRFDHMQQHTGQHLLSAILDKRNIPTLSWSMGRSIINDPSPSSSSSSPFPSFNYIEVNRKLTQEEIDSVQEDVNTAIQDCLDINIKIPDDQKEEDLESNEKGVIRHVTIGGIDNNPCCGTHLRNTSHISALSLMNNIQTIRGTNCRLFFLAGQRVTDYSRAANDQIRKVNSTLSCTTEDIDNKLSELNLQLKSARGMEKYWSGELAVRDGQKLLDLANKFSESTSISNVSVENNNNNKDANITRSYNGYLLYNPKGTMDYFRAVEKEIGSLDQFKPKVPFVFVFAGGQINESGVIIVIGTDKSAIEDTAKRLKELIPDVKGGGKGKWQGKVVSWNNSGIKSLDNLF